MNRPRNRREAISADVLIADHGSVMIVTPMTDMAREWVEDNVVTDQWWGRGFAVEPRFMMDLAAGMEDAGLNIATSDF